MRSSSVGIADADTGSESPIPRLSKTINRENDASRLKKRLTDGSSQYRSRCETQPGM